MNSIPLPTRCSRHLKGHSARPRHAHGRRVVPWRRAGVQCSGLSEGCSHDSGQPSGNSTLQQKQARLEALLAQEGIELAQSSGPSVLGFSTPDVDWSRYHVQILFVDRTDTLRARVAAGIFDRIAAWNGFGRAMLSWSCGLDAQAPAPTLSLLNRWNSPSAATWEALFPSPTASAAASLPGAARTAAVLSAASALELSVREVARPAEQFEVEDLDRYDLVVCLDRGIREAILSQVAPTDREYYEDKVCLLGSFSRYEGDFVLLARGGFALLPMQFSFLLRNGRKALSLVKQQEDIASPELAGEQGMMEWNDMVQALICCTAGLAKYLMDAQPDHHWEPED